MQLQKWIVAGISVILKEAIVENTYQRRIVGIFGHLEIYSREVYGLWSGDQI